ncbi:N-6 DNA methylase [Dehalococcoides mccartyi]
MKICIYIDPACGTGGFLVSAFEHLKKQCKTAEDHNRLQQESLFGIEAKPLPYLLCQMNLLLHGLEYPNIDPLNALRFPLREIGDKDRVDVILTNPPFGGSEEKGIQGNFPLDLQTSETALLFIQLIVRKLKRNSGRCAMVVHDGVLSNVGIASRVKQNLLDECNLHTIIRLPSGVFEPYTPIKTNLLFFEKGQKTKGIWFYEIQISDGRKKYTKTKPITLAEFDECSQWWKERKQTNKSWYVDIEKIQEKDFNLDFRNPNIIDKTLPDNPKELIKEITSNLDTMTKATNELDMLIKEWKIQ